MDPVFTIGLLAWLFLSFWLIVVEKSFDAPEAWQVVLGFLAIDLILSLMAFAGVGAYRSNNPDNWKIVSQTPVEEVVVLPDGKVECFIRDSSVGYYPDPVRYIMKPSDKRPKLILRKMEITGWGPDNQKSEIVAVEILEVETKTQIK